MILNDEKVLEVIGQANLLKNTNYYFSGTVMPTPAQYALLGVFSNLLKEVSGYIINYTEEGIGIIPINNMSGKPMIDNAYFIPNSSIQKVEINKGGLFFYKKITIVDNNNQSISFKVVKNVLPMKKYKENLEAFIQAYSNK
ncbi:MAG: hypothetical protein VZS44_00650 [Bacilli bacterium]|nr:hypothetical protein [Bacilli bacterium]